MSRSASKRPASKQAAQLSADNALSLQSSKRTRQQRSSEEDEQGLPSQMPTESQALASTCPDNNENDNEMSSDQSPNDNNDDAQSQSGENMLADGDADDSVRAGNSDDDAQSGENMLADGDADDSVRAGNSDNDAGMLNDMPDDNNSIPDDNHDDDADDGGQNLVPPNAQLIKDILAFGEHKFAIHWANQVKDQIKVHDLHCGSGRF